MASDFRGSKMKTNNKKISVTPKILNKSSSG